MSLRAAVCFSVRLAPPACPRHAGQKVTSFAAGWTGHGSGTAEPGRCGTCRPVRHVAFQRIGLLIRRRLDEPNGLTMFVHEHLGGSRRRAAGQEPAESLHEVRIDRHHLVGRGVDEPDRRATGRASTRAHRLHPRMIAVHARPARMQAARASRSRVTGAPPGWPQATPRRARPRGARRRGQQGWRGRAGRRARWSRGTVPAAIDVPVVHAGPLATRAPKPVPRAVEVPTPMPCVRMVAVEVTHRRGHAALSRRASRARAAQV